MNIRVIALVVAACTLTASLGVTWAARAQSQSGGVGVVTPTVVNRYPHATDAFTQGLIFHGGELYESVGPFTKSGMSELRRVRLQTGEIVQRRMLPPKLFAEGLTLHDGRLFQLTWQDKLGIVYDPKTFDVQRTWTYNYEGWGVTTDGTSLIVSDGTSTLRFLDPQRMTVQRTVRVTVDGQPLAMLNELEFVNGEVWANVWHTNRIARIDPRTGNVRSWLDLSNVAREVRVTNPEAVLNGIAYDAASGRLFVTGKLWPTLFEIRVPR